MGTADLPADWLGMRRRFNAGFADQVVVTRHMGARSRLVRLGRHGHLVCNVVPLTRTRGVGSSEMDMLMA